MATTELSAEQMEAVEAFGLAAVSMSAAMQGLEQAGVDIRSALQAITTGEGRTLWDELPGSLKMML